ncbi:hypothetical protein HYC85_030361 [Camellia sinensis]|uniref:Uncharacterized protein n=1 Tax=Camellia sinensis TaxID=4442 RepID=A0A7J7G0J0_CAMSI|nr:hypothetical protein HYC85_030361 [Camellia sinensis]
MVQLRSCRDGNIWGVNVKTTNIETVKSFEQTLLTIMYMSHIAPEAHNTSTFFSLPPPNQGPLTCAITSSPPFSPWPPPPLSPPLPLHFLSLSPPPSIPPSTTTTTTRNPPTTIQTLTLTPPPPPLPPPTIAPLSSANTLHQQPSTFSSSSSSSSPELFSSPPTSPISSSPSLSSSLLSLTPPPPPSSSSSATLRSRKCENPRCKALKKAMEFDLQLQTEECLRSAATGSERDRRAAVERRQ